jgi:hypothetical protein
MEGVIDLIMLLFSSIDIRSRGRLIHFRAAVMISHEHYFVVSTDLGEQFHMRRTGRNS